MKKRFEQYYEDLLSRFGATAQGVSWKNESAQYERFEQLIKIFKEDNFTINDLGCGIGNFVDFLKSTRFRFKYYGYDVMDKMVQQARELHQKVPDASFEVINSASEMHHAQYTVASGIFNIRFDASDETWLSYIHETLHAMNDKSSHGFAFNLLTTYSDAEFMRQDLYYADPGAMFDYCKRNFSRNVALLHDYDIYDFTILVRKIV